MRGTLLTLALACLLLPQCHGKGATIKFISGPEVVTDLGEYREQSTNSMYS